MKTVIRVDRLSKAFLRTAPGHKLRTLKSAFLERSLVRDLNPEETIPALSEVTFDVGQGEAFGVIGSNGSGKSTLLKLVAGILKPTSGSVAVDGRTAALIELGAGFHPEISGRENVYINAAVLGLSRREVDRRYDEIVEFSGLGDFMEEPVKNYSSGMYVRLGFAVAIHTDPDVLLVDEVLAVGDEEFAHRCLRRIEEFLAEGKTLLLVSHSLELVEKLSDRVLWLDKGKQQLVGPPRRVVDAYRQAVAEAESEAHRAARDARIHDLEEDVEASAADEPDDLSAERWGSRAAVIRGVRLLGADGGERYHFRSGEEMTIEIDAATDRAMDDFVFGIAIATPRGIECWGTNTHLQGFEPERFDGEATVRVICPSLELAPGDYSLDVAVHSREGVPYDYHRRLLTFTVTGSGGGVGIYFPRHRWDFGGAISIRTKGDG